MTEWLPFHFSLSCIGEGNGNPLQCSCLENPRDGGAWWAAVYGVAQSRARLKRLSSSSRSKQVVKESACVGFRDCPECFSFLWTLSLRRKFCLAPVIISMSLLVKNMKNLYIIKWLYNIKHCLVMLFSHFLTWSAGALSNLVATLALCGFSEIWNLTNVTQELNF